MRFQCSRARDHYRKAREAADQLPLEDRRALMVAEIMRGIYARILDRIERSGYRVYDARVGLPPPYRLAIATGIWLRSLLS